MANVVIPEVQPLLHQLRQYVQHQNQPYIGVSYDVEGDVLYVSFCEPNIAADSELTEDNVIVRYDDEDHIIGLTILDASKRR
jgi:uncharacterized protein YuzE